MIYQDPELVKDIMLSNIRYNLAVRLFFNKGYKIKGIDYENRISDSIKTAKTIFMKDEYKYIE